MPRPNGGLITETNRQYYAGAQQFYIDTAGAGKTFTSTFDTRFNYLVALTMLVANMVLI